MEKQKLPTLWDPLCALMGEYNNTEIACLTSLGKGEGGVKDEAGGCEQWHKVQLEASSTPGSSAPLGPVFFNIFSNDLNEKAECTFHKFAGDSNEEGMADSPESHAAIQRGLNKLEKWADRCLIKFNKENCEVLQLGRTTPDNSPCWESFTWKVGLQKRTYGSWCQYYV